MDTHLFSYRYEGADYVVEIPASSVAEARARIAQMTWARYDGVLISKTPASIGFLTPLQCWIRNTLARLFHLSGNS